MLFDYINPILKWYSFCKISNKVFVEVAIFFEIVGYLTTEIV